MQKRGKVFLLTALVELPPFQVGVASRGLGGSGSFEMGNEQKTSYPSFFLRQQKYRQAEENTTFVSLDLFAMLSPDPPLN